MGDEYRQLSQHRQRAHCAVRYERARDYLRAVETWLLVSRVSPQKLCGSGGPCYGLRSASNAPRKQPARKIRVTPSSRI